jgi:DNA-binding CsgD family transcriptional regulator
VTDGHCWGYLCLHREDSRLGFTTAEIDRVKRLAPRIARGLRGAALLAASSIATTDAAPGVLVLSQALEVVASTTEAQRLLSLLPGGNRALPRLPLVVRGVAMALQASEREAARQALAPSVRLRTSTGSWLTAHASWLSEAPGERRISVVLAPARAADTVPLLLAAHGLTPRESDVARLVLRGAPTATIVDTLHISRYTVQDHLRAVFDKVGVRSRRDLAGRLLAGS